MEFSLSIAIVGFCLGYIAALRLQDRNAPPVIGICSAIIFFIASDMLLRIFLVVAPIVAFIVLYRRVWPTIHEALVGFGQNAGTRVLRWRYGAESLAIIERLRGRIDDIDMQVKQVEQSSISQHEKRSLLDKLRADRDLFSDSLDNI